MKRSTQEVEKGTEATVTASKAMGHLIESISAISDSTELLARSAESMLHETATVGKVIETMAVGSEQTAAAAEELSATSAEVSNTIHRVATDIEHQAAAIQTMNATATELSVMAADLTELSSHFTLALSTTEEIKAAA
jgi:methyl-accepting chemotaxis protein